MNQFKFEAFLREFSFLYDILCRRNWIPPERIEDIVVKRISPELLGCKREVEATGYALDADGSVVMYMGPCSVSHRKGKTFHNKGEKGVVKEEMPYPYKYTIGEALQRLTQPNVVSYIVWFSQRFNGVTRITVYKPPKRFTVMEWIEEQIRRANEQISATVAEIDAEA